MKELLVGAHTSAAGGPYKALLHGQDIGATTIQLFTSNQKTWEPRQLSEEDLLAWQNAKEGTGIHVTMSHDSYLINLAAPDAGVWHKSKKAFAKEIERCHALDITYMNFHPGAFTSSSAEAGLDRIVESLLEMTDLAASGNTRLLLETTAGQGTCLGARFEDLAYIIKHTHKHLPIGVCIDTCHIFAAGYDIRTPSGWKETLHQFDAIIGLEHLYALHVNDSLQPFASHKDRHASLGDGHIGLDAFKFIMHHPKLRHLPKYLETPDPDKWPQEIQLLRSYYAQHSSVSL